eukprot:scaffold187690_cov30-Prasinocladus_malaysianus.AAC.2
MVLPNSIWTIGTNDNSGINMNNTVLPTMLAFANDHVAAKQCQVIVLVLSVLGQNIVNGR